MSNSTEQFAAVRTMLNERVLGQEALIDRMLIALLADGHILVEGAPGLAKTSAIKALAECVDCAFHRIQFTPDLLPADLTGSDVYRPSDGSFEFSAGPLFNNLLLADEINRAPAKVQSALLEAMEERQVTVGRTSRPLPEPFLVMATRNPIEQEGTFALPEAQLDRFLLHVLVGHPDADVELQVLRLNRALAASAYRGEATAFAQKLTPDDVSRAREAALATHMAEGLEQYIVDLVVATRSPGELAPEFANSVRLGASPRATLALDRCARARAWLEGRDHVQPVDVHAIAHDVLRHRVLLSFEAEAGGVRSDDVVKALLDVIPVP